MYASLGSFLLKENVLVVYLNIIYNCILLQIRLTDQCFDLFIMFSKHSKIKMYIP